MCGLPLSMINPAAWRTYSPACGMPVRTSTSSLPGGRRINPGKGVVFVTPLRGDREVNAAANLGFDVTRSLHELRVQGENKPGVAANLTEKLAAAVSTSADSPGLLSEQDSSCTLVWTVPKTPRRPPYPQEGFSAKRHPREKLSGLSDTTKK